MGEADAVRLRFRGRGEDHSEFVGVGPEAEREGLRGAICRLRLAGRNDPRRRWGVYFLGVLTCYASDRDEAKERARELAPGELAKLRREREGRAAAAAAARIGEAERAAEALSGNEVAAAQLTGALDGLAVRPTIDGVMVSRDSAERLAAELDARAARAAELAERVDALSAALAALRDRVGPLEAKAETVDQLDELRSGWDVSIEAKRADQWWCAITNPKTGSVFTARGPALGPVVDRLHAGMPA